MTEVLQSSPSHFPSPSSSSPTSCAANDGTHPHGFINNRVVNRGREADEEDIEERDGERKERDREGDQLSFVTVLVAAFRRSLSGCSVPSAKDLCSMEIGLPTNVRHVAHVTFDRFNGFLGLPVEFEPEVPRRAPSASANVFGVSTESMQLSYDSRGNCVPTILLMMQRHLYAQSGLQAEGIFRINGGNSQEEYVREQLNRGVIPDGVDVHCLAGLIKAWFRELPTGVLDSLSPEQVMQSQTEEECAQLVRLLPPTEAALLDWAINLMADVAQLEHMNKMNARNIAMVFAPNMTQMSDPLTALMYAVQVMNFLKTLIIKTLKERQDSSVETISASCPEPSDGNGHESSSQLYIHEKNEDDVEDDEQGNSFVAKDPALKSPLHPTQNNSNTEQESKNFLASIENILRTGNQSLADNCPCQVVSQVNALINGLQETSFRSPNSGGHTYSCKIRSCQSTDSSVKNGSKKSNDWRIGSTTESTEKRKGAALVGRINSRAELFEAWR